jgi:hypothetical protein
VIADAEGELLAVNVTSDQVQPLYPAWTTARQLLALWPWSFLPIRPHKLSLASRTAKAYSQAKLVRSLGVYRVDGADDLFLVDYLGEQITVKRRDIERADR